jgi:hypothetical protein
MAGEATATKDADPVAVAMDALARFCASKTCLRLVTTPVPAEELDRLADKALPRSYLRFLATYGTFHVALGGVAMYGIDAWKKCIGLFVAEPLASAATYLDHIENNEDYDLDQLYAFQRIDDDDIENFYCFDLSCSDADGECTVIGVYCEDADPSGGSDSESHLVEVIEKFMRVYADEP